jgi:hypothetical protein
VKSGHFQYVDATGALCWDAAANAKIRSGQAMIILIDNTRSRLLHLDVGPSIMLMSELAGFGLRSKKALKECRILFRGHLIYAATMAFIILTLVQAWDIAGFNLKDQY